MRPLERRSEELAYTQQVIPALRELLEPSQKDGSGLYLLALVQPDISISLLTQITVYLVPRFPELLFTVNMASLCKTEFHTRERRSRRVLVISMKDHPALKPLWKRDLSLLDRQRTFWLHEVPAGHPLKVNGFSPEDTLH